MPPIILGIISGNGVPIHPIPSKIITEAIMPTQFGSVSELIRMPYIGFFRKNSTFANPYAASADTSTPTIIVGTYIHSVTPNARTRFRAVDEVVSTVL